MASTKRTKISYFVQLTVLETITLATATGPQALYYKHVPETHQFEAVAVPCTVRFTEVQSVDLSCRAITKQ